MKRSMILLFALLLILSGCGASAGNEPQAPQETVQPEPQQTPEPQPTYQVADEGGMMKLPYQQISQATARMMMKADDGHVVVDVRRQEEYDEGHIPGAILIPNESIETERPEELPDLYQIILIYCHSGRRSKEAAQKLADMGYVNLYEFGGIIDWEYDIVTSEQENAE